MKYAILCALLLSPLSLQSFDDCTIGDIAGQIESELDAAFNQESSIVNSFSNFMHNLVALLAEKTAQAKIILHNLFISVVELSQQLIKGDKRSPAELSQADLVRAIDQQLFGQLTNITVDQAMSVTFLKARPIRPTNKEINAKHKADVQRILNFFAAIVQNFFAIVQDPHNKENVVQGVAGIVGNIIGAGNTIINDSQQQAGPENIAQVVESIDPATKQQILDLLLSQGKAVRIDRNF